MNYHPTMTAALSNERRTQILSDASEHRLVREGRQAARKAQRTSAPLSSHRRARVLRNLRPACWHLT
jgi:hypothetical protein